MEQRSYFKGNRGPKTILGSRDKRNMFYLERTNEYVLLCHPLKVGGGL